FVERVPADLLPRLHKLVREKEQDLEAQQDQSEGGEEGGQGKEGKLDGNHLLAAIVTELRARLPASAEAPGEEFVFNKSVGVSVCFLSLSLVDVFRLPCVLPPVGLIWVVCLCLCSALLPCCLSV